MLCSKRTKNLQLFFALLAVLVGMSFWQADEVEAASLKIKMNGKTSYYRGKQSEVFYNSKRVSKAGLKGLTIKSVRMAPYNDVFKKGLKVKTTYSASKKKIVMTKNGVSVTLTIGSKNAYVNGKKYKLKSAPVKVRYVKKKKTKILVPVKFLCKHLGFSYSASGTTITLKEKFMIEYDGVTKNSSAKGVFNFNGKDNTLSSMPVIKVGSHMYVPAEETLKSIMGLEYSYNTETGVLKVGNEATNKKLELTLGATLMQVNGANCDLSAPMRMVTRKDTGASVLCIPANSVFKQLGYDYKWSKTKNRLSIHDLIYFDWKAKDQNTSNDTNCITEAKATYNPDLGCISLAIKGTNVDLMNQVTVTRDDKVITITIPAKSKYCLEHFSFSKFVNTLEKMEVVEESSGNVVIKITSHSVADFAYSSLDGVLTINVMGEYIGDYAMKIMKPSGLTINDVSNEDLYNSKKFKITLKGNHVDYFNANPIVINSDVISDVSITLSTEGNTVITVTTTKIQGYKIYNKSDSFVVTMGKPRDIFKNIVVLDAGHGGYDNGASNKGTREKDLNYTISYTLMKDYFASNAPDTKVYWTRTTDTFITLANRAAFASKVGADMFISLHMNSATSSSANGTEVYYSTSNNGKSFSGITSKTMATLMNNNLVSNLGTNNRGVKKANFYVIKNNTVPAILIELGFLSGSSDYSKLVNPTFQRNSAKIIYDTINQIFTSYPTGR